MILWSMRTFWCKGSAENKGKWQIRAKARSLKNSSPDSKADFPEKFLLGINFECVAYNIACSTYNIEYPVYKAMFEIGIKSAIY